MNCEFRCESGWLPLDREEDHDAIDECYPDGSTFELPLLMPTQFVACVCNPLSMFNDDLKEISV